MVDHSAAVVADPYGYVIEGNLIVGKDKINLPHVCVKCGEKLSAESDVKRQKKDLYYIFPLVYILIFFQLLIFLIVYMIFRKKCRVEYSVCRPCHWDTQVNWIYFLVAIAALVGSIVAAVQLDTPWLLLGCLVSVIAMIVFANRANGPIKVAKYKNKTFYLKGAKTEALQAVATESAYQSPYAAILAEDGRMG